MFPFTRHIDASAQQVFDVLSDGWLYPLWVVGASRMRSVDATWPEPGSQLHHSVGGWPLLLDDSTEVVEYSRPRLIRLVARGRPFGEAEVSLEVQDDGHGGCVVTMREDVLSGPARLVPKPFRQLGVLARNRESLIRLALLVEGRARG